MTISAKQRKVFWAIANRIGKESAYDVLHQVAGVESLRDPRLDEQAMTGVLDELIKAAGPVRRKQKRPEYRRPMVDEPRGKVIRLISAGQRGYIDRVRREIGFTEEALKSYCQRIIKRDEPATTQEAQALIAALKSMRYQRWKANGH